MFHASGEQTRDRIFCIVDWLEAQVAGLDQVSACGAREQPQMPCHFELVAQAWRGADAALTTAWRRSSMTMQDHQSSGSSYFQSVTVQLLTFGVGIVALIVLAAVFVF